MEERNLQNLSVVESDCHLCLNILDIITFLEKNKLDYLGDEVATEIVTSFNNCVEEEFYIESQMTGVELREIFQKLPNDLKNTMKKKTIISDLTSKAFFTNLIHFSSEENEFLKRDDEVKGSLVNMFSILVIITSGIIFWGYHVTASSRGELGVTVAGQTAQLVKALIESYLP